MKKSFLNSINYFRGIAIIIIVFGHSYGLSRIEVDTIFDRAFFSLMKHGSVYFIFISGFLFHHIYFVRKANFSYRKYLGKKISYVFVPYLAISIIPIVIRVFYLNDKQYVADWASDNNLLSVLWYISTGRIFVGYWYVPTGMILFFLSPLVIWIVKSKYCLPAIISLMSISLVIHRPILNLNPIHSTIYFFPTYILGCYASQNRKYIYSYMKDKRLIFGILAILLALIQALFWEHPGAIQRSSWLIDSNLSLTNTIDIILIQKIIICFLLMSWLSCYEDSDIKILDKIANQSFAVYFIHPILMSIGRSLLFKSNLYDEGNYLIWLAVGCSLLFGSMAIAQTIKIIFKKNSRYLIGW